MKKRVDTHRRNVLLLLAALLFASCSQSDPASTPSTQVMESPVDSTATAEPTLLPIPQELPVLVDVDMGSSDVIALLYLLSLDNVDVKAITVSGTGEGYCSSGVATAQQLLILMGQESVPVACGREEPLRGGNRFPISWRARTRRFAGLELPEVETEPSDSAVELLKDTILDTTSKVVLLTLGPLTNVADAFMQYPELAGRIDRIVTMGGAIHAAGNLAEGSTAEWNIWIDPYATEIVLESGVPVTLIPLDATNYVSSSFFTYEALDTYHETPAAEAVFNMFAADPNLYADSYYFWDPLTAASLVHPELVQITPLKLEVVQQGEEEGRTVEGPAGTEVLVALEADSEGFEQSLISVLNGGIPVSLPERIADISVTFDGNACAFEGPTSVPPGRLIIQAENLSDDRFGVPTVTLNEGKGVQDLLDWAREEKPPWADLLSYVEPARGGRSFAAVDVIDGPVYVLCVVPPITLDVMTLNTAEQ